MPPLVLRERLPENKNLRYREHRIYDDIFGEVNEVSKTQAMHISQALVSTDEAASSPPRRERTRTLRCLPASFYAADASY